MITEEQLREWRELAEKATPGRWQWWTSNSWRRLKSELGTGTTRNVLEPYTVWHDKHPDCLVHDDDMDFIAASRTAVPALCEEVERLREALSLAETIIRQLPENGKNWNLLSRFWAASSAARSSLQEGNSATSGPTEPDPAT